MMTVDHRLDYLKTTRTYLALAVSPLQYVVSFPIAGAQWLSRSFAQRTRLLEENKQMRDDNLILKMRLQRFEDLQRENERLRSLLESSKKISERVLIAEVMAVDLDPYARKMLINKGEYQGVEKSLPLLDAQGVMGQVIETGLFSSTAMLITDPAHALPVQVKRSGLHTVVAGTGAANSLALLYLSNTAEIRVGDELVTSGLGGVFPAGYPVGIVTEVSRDVGKPFAEAKAKPSALLDHNRDVLIIWPALPPPQPPAPPATPVAEPVKPDPAQPAAPTAGRSPQ